MIDPMLDAEVEEIVERLSCLIPQMHANVGDACRWMSEQTIGSSSFLKRALARQADDEKWRDRLASSDLRLAKDIESDLRYVKAQRRQGWKYLYKDGADAFVRDSRHFWPAYLKENFPEQSELNEQIETLFDRWYRLLDAGPERQLRRHFLKTLMCNNQLGEILRDWGGLHDMMSPRGSDRPTRVEALSLVKDIFERCYYEPFGIKSRPSVKLFRAHRMRTHFKSDTRTIRMAVPTNFDTPPHLRPVPASIRHDNQPYPNLLYRESFSDLWNGHPSLAFVMLLEECLHGFQHAIAAMYLDGKAPSDRWAAFGRILLPQFALMPGRHLYDKGTYYLYNPIERHAEDFDRAVYGTLYTLNIRAEEAKALECNAESRLPDTSISLDWARRASARRPSL